MMLQRSKIAFKLNLVTYLQVWLVFIFITSFVVSNSIKGTTPAFIFAGLSIPVVLCLARKSRGHYVRLMAVITGCFFLYQIVTQLALLIDPSVPYYNHLILVSNESKLLFRSSILTQSIYFVISICLFVYVTLYYRKEHHDKFIAIGALLVVIFGYYIWLFYILTGENGDIISNREFGDGNLNPGHFQTINVGPVSLSRFVGLVGEPSMYVYSILPITVYFFYTGKYRMFIVLVSSLVLTFSGTLLIGVVMFAFALVVTSGTLKRSLLYITVSIVLAWIVFSNEYASGIVDEILFAKLRQESDSGEDRIKTIIDNLIFYSDLPILTKLLGMGFGFVRSPEFLTTLLVNNGFLGILLFTGLVFYPIYKLKGADKRNKGLKYALWLNYIILFTSVSEFSYPSLWLILGISYNQIRAELLEMGN
ncbi:hypothetical protein F5984_17215 [Rudanella paleaurantiibacter]|uniref:O-antigen ligase domain-containing protein n=1 Tax=Rudanella paleaurantiibacter TaxID=2614655 RepID=A0A7J5TY58_9BACT|nr:hypothetical protein [Rudanella paleaurantiibacter]KAB7729363.1 hypothetical protein F5984_17215 [Rudanella paleaurantiibacter]